MKFSIKDFFSKCDQIRGKLRIWSHLLKKSFMENFIFCAVTCYGKTKCHFKNRIWEHLRILHLTEVNAKIDSNTLTVIQEHLLFATSLHPLKTFFILTKESNDFKLKVLEKKQNAWAFKIILGVIIRAVAFES